MTFSVKALVSPVLQELLAQTDSIEVLEPQSVRNQMRNFAKNMYHHYKDDKKK